MAKTSEPAEKGKKGGGISGAISAFGNVIDDIVREVKQDLKEMTPPEQAAGGKQKSAEEMAAQSSRLALLGRATAGTAEDYLEGDEAAVPPPAPDLPASTDVQAAAMPTGNLWDVLTDPVQGVKLRADACYHALTAADVEGYARAIANESAPPFTLGLVAVNITAFTDEDYAEAEGQQPEADLLTQTLQRAIAKEPRLFGAIGAGPRQLWPDVDALDDFLCQSLNSNRKLIALGPIGLDEPFAPYTLAAQQAQLERQLEIAAAFGIPALLTTRKTQPKLAETLEKVQRTAGGLPPLVYLDAVAGAEDFELVQRFNMHALLRPELTAPDFTGRDFYRQMSAEKLLLASGSALVAPHGFAGHFNEPKFLENSLTAGAQARGSKPAVLGPTTSQNLARLFGFE